jgi:2-haloacid dehalogenase
VPEALQALAGRPLAILSNGTPINAGRIGFVSSNSFDVIGAATYGFRSIWVNRSAAPLDQLGQPPQLTVADLAELVDAVHQDRR